ncbi:MAG: hypothetical protein GY753_09235 [Gammaproteobacteria bacterium]|nr:hypothetical protein [Gammaproteobacteria bacterium]
MPTKLLIGGDLPRLLRDIVEGLVAEELDIELVVDDVTADGLAHKLRNHQTDVLLIGCEANEMDRIGGELLAQPHHARIIAVANDDCNGVLYSLVPSRSPLGELSPQSLLDVIRAPVAGFNPNSME